ncbi:hypothetical protein RDV89_12800 [Nocardioides zeae]|uniref:DUF3592 domain-containing protein n=1 Tax=Nocardioides imazamoxiresistens TaxID=3231893 RepID=A0ABU3PXI4_9ACTN|nr:hypothetical protein [Nocardioides zeae]MDT9593953.1 hypothetical protein [Nocardioides zeae]
MSAHGPVHLRPPSRPGLVRLLNVVAVLGATLLVLGAPTWWFMHGTAQGWTEDRAVVVTLEADAECRTGPPPGNPRTCEATWTDADAPSDATPTSGEVSDRYGGDLPADGGTVQARVVSEGGTPMAFAGYHGFLLQWALVAPVLAVLGAVLLLGGALGLVRTDPRWAAARTDLPAPGAPDPPDRSPPG